MNSKHLLAISLALLLTTVCAVACSTREDAWEQIQRDGVMRVGLDPSFPPFETIVDGEVAGIDVDLARAIGAELGVDVRFDVIGYDGLYDALYTGRVDLLASALIVDESRTRDFTYSAPYFNAGQVLVSSPREPIEDTADLSAGSVAVELGAQGHVVALTLQQAQLVGAIAPYDSAEAALDAVAAGKASAAIVDHVSARLHAAQLVIAEQPLSVEPYALVVRIEDDIWLDELNNALHRLEESGALEIILIDWLDG